MTELVTRPAAPEDLTALQAVFRRSSLSHARAFYDAMGFVQHGVAQTRFMAAARMHLDLAASGDEGGT